MNKAEIKEIADYVKEPFESLYEWDHDPPAMEAELPILHKNIEKLMSISATTEEEEVRIMLAKIEHDARKCRECILRRLGMEN